MSTIDYSWRPEDYSEPFDPEELTWIPGHT